tara:strand:- start:176 stop:484 length:309 start_codon:yes stop_codon:yes gene_type:complete
MNKVVFFFKNFFSLSFLSLISLLCLAPFSVAFADEVLSLSSSPREKWNYGRNRKPIKHSVVKINLSKKKIIKIEERVEKATDIDDNVDNNKLERPGSPRDRW